MVYFPMVLSPRKFILTQNRTKTLSSVSALQSAPYFSSPSFLAVCLVVAAAAFHSKIAHHHQISPNRLTIQDGRTTITAIVEIPTLHPHIRRLRPDMRGGRRLKEVGRIDRGTVVTQGRGKIRTNSSRAFGMRDWEMASFCLSISKIFLVAL